jgi:hypothetical protein
MDTLLTSYGANTLAVLAINHGEKFGTASAFIRKLEVNLTAFGYDPDKTISRRYDVPGLPMTYFIDPRGVVSRVVAGALMPRLMESGVQEALGRGDVP